MPGILDYLFGPQAAAGGMDLTGGYGASPGLPPGLLGLINQGQFPAGPPTAFDVGAPSMAGLLGAGAPPPAAAAPSSPSFSPDLLFNPAPMGGGGLAASASAAPALDEASAARRAPLAVPMPTARPAGLGPDVPRLPDGSSTVVNPSPAPTGASFFDRLGSGIANNSNMLMAMGAGFASGGGVGGALKGAMAGAQLDQQQRMLQQGQLALYAAMKGKGATDAEAIAAATNPEFAKALTARNYTVPKVEAQGGNILQLDPSGKSGVLGTYGVQQKLGPGDVLATAAPGGAPQVNMQVPQKPMTVQPGSSIFQPGTMQPGTGGFIGQAPNEAIIDDATINDMARQYRAGDTSVTANLGRGAQGAENIVKLRQAIARQDAEAGGSPEERASKIAEFQGLKSGQRALGTRNANIEMAATEFKQVLPVVQQASQAVNRTNYPDLNKIVQAFEEHTGDPNVVAFGGGVNTLVNLYARSISPSGVGTVSDKEHAREILNRAWSQGQFNAAVGMMSQEIDAALASPEKVRDAMRQRFLGGTQGTSAAPTAPAPAPAPAVGTTTGGMPALPPGFQLVR